MPSQQQAQRHEFDGTPHPGHHILTQCRREQPKHALRIGGITVSNSLIVRSGKTSAACNQLCWRILLLCPPETSEVADATSRTNAPRESSFMTSPMGTGASVPAAAGTESYTCNRWRTKKPARVGVS